MSRKIKLTEEDINAMCIEFKNNLMGIRFDSEKITYTANTKLTNQEKVKVLFRPEAYCKMTTLIQNCSKEIAWHGIVDRREDGAYIISDIMMYPQEITGATVTSNDDKYPMWLMKHPDEIFNKIRFQGHSHVNFAANPSGVDTTLYSNMLQTLSDDDFYIFFIMNKRAEFWIQIYNLAENIVYEKEDIDLAILLSTNETMNVWYDKESKENIIEKKVTYTIPKTKTTTYSKATDKTWRWDYVRKRHVPVGATEADLKEVYKRAKEYSKGKSEYEEYLDIELQDLHDTICCLEDCLAESNTVENNIANAIVSDQLEMWNDLKRREMYD